VAKMYTTPSSPLSGQDVVITSGCSQALDLTISALADAGQNLLIPCPGFSLYQTVCENKGIEYRNYKLLPHRNWEADLEHMETLIDANTVAILVNNPSNPCGSVYSKQHLMDILALAEKHHLPVLADEIYGSMTFSGFQFYSLGELSTHTPVLVVGGIAKLYSVPGWRVGWIVIHDRHGCFKQVREGIQRLSQLTLGASSLPQSILPVVLHDTPKSYYESVNTKLETHARYCYDRLQTIAGLSAIQPQGAMYMMVGIDLNKFKDIIDDVDFSQKLLAEESVFVLPAQCFKQPNYFRIVICPPVEKLKIAFDRLEEFCRNHYA
jgi:tyrosine aminotransferase